MLVLEQLLEIVNAQRVLARIVRVIGDAAALGLRVPGLANRLALRAGLVLDGAAVAFPEIARNTV